MKQIKIDPFYSSLVLFVEIVWLYNSRSAIVLNMQY